MRHRRGGGEKIGHFSCIEFRAARASIAPEEISPELNHTSPNKVEVEH